MSRYRLLAVVCVLLSPVLGYTAPMSHLDAIALYAADASASLVLPISLMAESEADALLSRQVSDAISGVIASGAAQVDVYAEEGCVILRGQVANPGVLNQVLEMVNAVHGVKEVKTELTMVAS
jgi:osmotically-inducible protein OsmY